MIWHFCETLPLLLARLPRSRRRAVPRAQRARGVSRHAGGGAQGEQGAHRRHTGHHGPDQRGWTQHSRDREGGPHEKKVDIYCLDTIFTGFIYRNN